MWYYGTTVPMSQELVFRKIDKNHFSNESKLRVRPDQISYVCDNVEEFVRSWQGDDHIDCYLVGVANDIVGFFAVDFSHERHRSYTTEIDHFCVFRCFFIDERFQGQGYAAVALSKLGDLLAEQYRDLRKIVLTVNCKNKIAIKSYDKAGFKKLTALYLGGSAGPQYVMIKSL